MRRPSSLACLRAAAVGLPVLVACGTNAPPTGFGGDTGSTTQNNDSGSTSTQVYTSTSTTILADGGTSTTVVTSTVTASHSTTGGGSTSSPASSGSSASGDAGADAGARMCPIASAAVVADFEDAKAQNVAANGFTGSWFAAASAGTASKAVVGSTDTAPTCNKYALEGIITGPIASSGYANVGTHFLVDSLGTTATATYPLPVDVSSYNAISFDVRTGANATKYPITFEMVGQDSTPVTDANSHAIGGTATTAQVDQYNHRGWLISSLTSGWQTVTVPFGAMIPHWLPSPGSSGCGTSGPCAAPVFDAKHMLGMQFSVNPDQSPNGTFDLVVDNVTLVSDPNAGLTPPGMTMPTWHDGTFASCTKPAGASGRYLLWAYSKWKAQFVKGNSGSSRYVYSPEISGGSVVSEGIGYGLLLAVYFDDQPLFNDLWSFWSAKEVGGTHLMQWKWSGDGSSNTGSGSATDADEDAAFALIEAGKKWGGSYASTASSIIGDIWSHDIDQSNLLPLGGSQGYSSTSVKNPSYFAPAYYRIFSGIDSGHAWTTVAANVYTAINSLTSAVSSSDGLLPAWSNSSFSAAASNGAATDVDYQYDSHRIPWRIGVDYCWNGTSAATTFLNKNSGFFAGIAGTNGIGRIVDIYTPSGSASPNAVPNSISIVGSAAVGAMHSASDSAFTDQAWQFVLDGLNRATLDVNATGGSSGYSYYNSTIGLMTALTMSGNFYPM